MAKSDVPDIRSDDPIVSIPEAARLLNVSRQTARVWAGNGRLPARLFSGRYAAKLSDVMDLRRKLAASPSAA
jgi:excisionase family DNA binding protein